MDFLPALALIFSGKILDILAFFNLMLLKSHIRPSLYQYVVFVLYIYEQKIFVFLRYFD